MSLANSLPKNPGPAWCQLRQSFARGQLKQARQLRSPRHQTTPNPKRGGAKIVYLDTDSQEGSQGTELLWEEEHSRATAAPPGQSGDLRGWSFARQWGRGSVERTRWRSEGRQRKGMSWCYSACRSSSAHSNQLASPRKPRVMLLNSSHKLGVQMWTGHRANCRFFQKHDEG